MSRIREQAERDYQLRMADEWEEMQAEERRRERLFNTYCRDRANGLTHEEAGDECRSLAEGFRVEYERQMAEYHKAMGRAVEPRDVANANLISAAPELLEAAQLIVDIYDSYGAGFYNQQQFLDGLRAARAAIAKAEGK